MAGFPASVPDVDIYAGDTFEWPRYRFLADGEPIDLTAWTGWAASWRPTPSSSHVVALTLDLSEAATGYVTVSADSDATRAMQNVAAHMYDGFGYWDLQANQGAVVRTWVRGRTTNREDVT